MEHLQNSTHKATPILIAACVLGVSFFIYANRFGSKTYISDEIISEVVTKPITVEIEKVSEEMNYNDVLSDLNSSYLSLETAIEEIQPVIKDLKNFYQESEDALVCPDANKAFNSFSESYTHYRELLQEIKICTQTYESKYAYLGDDVKSIILDPETANENGLRIIADEQNILEMYTVAKEKADKLYVQDFDIITRVGFAEAGAKPSADPEEHYAVWGVIYNRVKDEDYPSTPYDVIYSGAYACVSDGNIDKEAPELVKDYAEDYLRGNVNFDMPDDVVFQARSKQTSSVWWESPLGHYFCRK